MEAGEIGVLYPLITANTTRMMKFYRSDFVTILHHDMVELYVLNQKKMKDKSPVTILIIKVKLMK